MTYKSMQSVTSSYSRLWLRIKTWYFVGFSILNYWKYREMKILCYLGNLEYFPNPERTNKLGNAKRSKWQVLWWVLWDQNQELTVNSKQRALGIFPGSVNWHEMTPRMVRCPVSFPRLHQHAFTTSCTCTAVCNNCLELSSPLHWTN